MIKSNAEAEDAVRNGRSMVWSESCRADLL